MIRSNLGDLQSKFYIVYTSYGFVKRSLRGIHCSMSIEGAVIIHSPTEAEECAREAMKEYGTTVIFELPSGAAYEVE